MKKRETVSSLKKDAWAWFSKYIRLRDGLLTMGSKEEGKCVTCGHVIPLWTRGGMQAGHFIDSRSKEVLFDEKLVHAQCYSCNMGKSGNKDAYAPFMIQRYGIKFVEEAYARKKRSLASTQQWDKDELRAIRDEYKELFQSTFKDN